MECVESRYIVSIINVIWAVDFREGWFTCVRRDVWVRNTSAVVAPVLAHLIGVFLAHVAVSEMAVTWNVAVVSGFDNQDVIDIGIVINKVIRFLWVWN